jgi:hypothetical protein
MYGKRLTLPERWLTPRFRKLKPHEKLAYLYILEHCDWAGFMVIDNDKIAFDTQIPIEQIEEVLNKLNEDEIELNNSGWLFVLDFIELQQGKDKEGRTIINPDNKAHKNIISKMRDNIKHFENCLRTKENLAPYLGLISSSGNSIGKAIGKGMDKGISNGKDVLFGLNSINVIYVAPRLETHVN